MKAAGTCEMMETGEEKVFEVKSEVESLVPGLGGGVSSVGVCGCSSDRCKEGRLC